MAREEGTGRRKGGEQCGPSAKIHEVGTAMPAYSLSSGAEESQPGKRAVSEWD